MNRPQREAPDPGAATIPPASLRLPRLPLLDTATPPGPDRVDFELLEVEPELDAEADPPGLGHNYDPELKFANLPLLHMPIDERIDLRLRRLIQLSERQVDASEAATKGQGELLRLLQSWDGAVLQRAADAHADGVLNRKGKETCLSWLELLRQLVMHPKALQGFGTLALAVATMLGIYDYISPLLLPWLP